jgi:hypothetical protein
MNARKAVTRETGREDQNAGKKEKGLILNHLVRFTGYNRKYAIRVLSMPLGETATMVGDGNPVEFKRKRSRGRKIARVNHSTHEEPSPAWRTSGGFTGMSAVIWSKRWS